MSTNCVNCVVNDRTGTDLLCDECRAKKRRSSITKRLRDDSWRNMVPPFPVAELEVWHRLCCDAADEIDALRDEFKDKFLYAFIAGLTEYAWWKDGTQYVGTCGTTLTQAIDRAKAERGGQHL